MSQVFENLKQLARAQAATVQSLSAKKILLNAPRCLHCKDIIDNPKQVFCDSACAWEHEQDLQEAEATNN